MEDLTLAEGGEEWVLAEGCFLAWGEEEEDWAETLTARTTAKRTAATRAVVGGFLEEEVDQVVEIQAACSQEEEEEVDQEEEEEVDQAVVQADPQGLEAATQETAVAATKAPMARILTTTAEAQAAFSQEEEAEVDQEEEKEEVDQEAEVACSQEEEEEGDQVEEEKVEEEVDQAAVDPPDLEAATLETAVAARKARMARILTTMAEGFLAATADVLFPEAVATEKTRTEAKAQTGKNPERNQAKNPTQDRDDPIPSQIQTIRAT
jgi:hypothetical protein